jgi:type IV pilus assembly protein PilV
MSRLHAFSFRRRTERGFSLIEVLISVLVLALGLLGIAAMQALALRNNQSALERTQGIVHTYYILDAMRANRAGAIIGQYDQVDWLCAAPDPTSLASRDLNAWITSMRGAGSLGPSACGLVDCEETDDGELCTVSVRWSDARGQDGVEEYEVQTRTLL